ncbi:MAG TPA: Ig-like domain-containing protein, partial [Saprospiraceae bacterium]|nr:Ig-like domain-containing protein [Saprospiraceae bacterium]
FFFDDINISVLTPDVTAPSLVTLEVLDQNSLLITFDEAIETGSAAQLTNYVLQPSGLNPNTTNLNGNQITLIWTNPFVSLQPYTLTVMGLKDQAGNMMTTTSSDFTYTAIASALANELLITEIMADPTPVIGLPDAEYLEIYNPTNKVFRLSDYTLTVGSSERSLPNELIYPGEFVILCDPDFVSLLSPFGKTVGVNSMPALTNSGAYIAIKDLTGDIIHDLTYSTSWYKDPDKANGGWSLEMKNPFHSCSGETNWAAATALIGGTPGTQNVPWEITPDTEGPVLNSVYASTAQNIELRFDERLDATLMENPNAYVILPPVAITDALLVNPASVQLSLGSALQAGIVYQLIPFDAYDCLGNNRHLEDTVKFGLIVDAQPGDIYINEILFNPLSGGSRFLEVINKSDKFINLNSLVIARLTSTQQDLYATGLEEVLGPGEITAFSPDPQDILSRYTVPNPGKLYQSSLPSWDDKSDNVSILVAGMVIDSFTYSSEWHHPVIADQNGVSLERVSLDVSPTVSSNWHSASSLSGYATPTGENSQTLNSNINPETPYTITNRNFSPNDDGYKDYLALEFEAGSGDDIASMWVYDKEGREVQQLLSNELIGTSGLVTWDGRNEDGVVSEMGIYILFIRLWKADGEVNEYQESCALIKR